jgi:hypothetical protein
MVPLEVRAGLRSRCARCPAPAWQQCREGGRAPEPCFTALPARRCAGHPHGAGDYQRAAARAHASALPLPATHHQPPHVLCGHIPDGWVHGLLGRGGGIPPALARLVGPTASRAGCKQPLSGAGAAVLLRGCSEASPGPPSPARRAHPRTPPAHHPVFKMRDPPLHDPCAVAYVIAPHLFQARRMASQQAAQLSEPPCGLPQA